MSKKHLYNLSLIASFFATLFLVIFVRLDALHAFDYVFGTAYYPIPSMAKPNKGVPYTDATFHTTITRITDPTDTSSLPGGTFDGIYMNYANISPANCDDTYLIFHTHNTGSYYIYYGPEYPDQTKRFKAKQIVAPLSNVTEAGGYNGYWSFSNQAPHWDNTNPNRLYFLAAPSAQGRFQGPKMYYYDVSVGGNGTILHDFSRDANISKYWVGWIPNGSSTDFYYIDWEEYNEPSADQKIWSITVYHAYAGNTHIVAVCTYQLDKNNHTDSPGGTLTQIACSTNANQIAIGDPKSQNTVSPDGTHVAIRRDGLTVTVFDKYLNKDGGSGWAHADTAIDADGNSVFAGVNLGPIKLDVSTNQGYTALSKDFHGWYDYNNHTTYAANTNSCVGEYSGHAYSKPGWVVVGGYLVLYPSYPTLEWQDYSIYAIELRRSGALWSYVYNSNAADVSYPNGNPPANPCRIWRIAHHHAYFGGNYNAIPQASFSPSGKYIYYVANWTVAGESPTDTNRTDIYQVTLPSTWWEDLKGNKYKSDTTPPTIPTGLKILK